MNGKGDKWRGGWTPKYEENHNRIFGDKMKKIYIFDVDGTLTPSRQRMTEEFAKFFDEWTSKNKYYLVTGSDIDKTKEQVPIAYIDRANGIFTCCGNQFYIEDELVYENKFTPPDSLIKDYFQYDDLVGEREKIASAIRFNWSKLDAVIGGQISIDIYPKGKDKSQVLDVIKQTEIIKPDEYIFIGDKIEGGGNDYPLAKLMEKIDNGSYHQTEGPGKTQKILEKLSD